MQYEPCDTELRAPKTMASHGGPGRANYSTAELVSESPPSYNQVLVTDALAPPMPQHPYPSAPPLAPYQAPQPEPHSCQPGQPHIQTEVAQDVGYQSMPRTEDLHSPLLPRENQEQQRGRRLQDFVLKLCGVNCCSGVPCVLLQFVLFGWGVTLIVLTIATSGGIMGSCCTNYNATADTIWNANDKLISTKIATMLAGLLMLLLNIWWIVLFAWSKITRSNENRNFAIPACLGFLLSGLFFAVAGMLAMGIYQHYELIVKGDCFDGSDSCHDDMMRTVPLWAGGSVVGMTIILIVITCRYIC